MPNPFLRESNLQSSWHETIYTEASNFKIIMTFGQFWTQVPRRTLREHVRVVKPLWATLKLRLTARGQNVSLPTIAHWVQSSPALTRFCFFHNTIPSELKHMHKQFIHNKPFNLLTAWMIILSRPSFESLLGSSTDTFRMIRFFSPSVTGPRLGASVLAPSAWDTQPDSTPSDFFSSIFSRDERESERFCDEFDNAKNVSARYNFSVEFFNWNMEFFTDFRERYHFMAFSQFKSHKWRPNYSQHLTINWKNSWTHLESTARKMCQTKFTILWQLRRWRDRWKRSFTSACFGCFSNGMGFCLKVRKGNFTRWVREIEGNLEPYAK